MQGYSIFLLQAGLPHCSTEGRGGYDDDDDDDDDGCQFVECSKHLWEIHAHGVYQGSQIDRYLMLYAQSTAKVHIRAKQNVFLLYNEYKF